MNKEKFNQVAQTSARLNKKIDKLKECQHEKEIILAWINSLSEQELITNEKTINQKMESNLNKFKQISEDIKKLNNF